MKRLWNDFFEKWEINIIPFRFFCNSLYFKSDSRCSGLDANHRKGGTERVEIKNEDDRTKKEEEEAEEKMEVEKVGKKGLAPRRRG